MSWYPAMSGRDASEVEVAEWAEELAGAASGYSSISFTTQSASVPDVEANRSTITSPATVRSRSRGGGVPAAATGRPETKRWSSTNHGYHFDPSPLVALIGRRAYSARSAGAGSN